MEVNIFPKGISPKVNVIELAEFELTYFDAAVQPFHHNTSVCELVAKSIPSM